MTDDRLITVAIHTYDRAVALKNLLEREGVHAVLHNVNLSTPVVSSGVRVRINESDLPLALRIIENEEIFASDDAAEAKEAIVLVPVDFSDYSLKAARMAFDIASRHRTSLMLLHSFINPAVSKRVQLTDAFSFDLNETQEVDAVLRREATGKMDAFVTRLKKAIKEGKLPPVKISTKIAEGVPEDVINETAKELQPRLIVMGTRGAGRKEEELIGSVTAELLDSCRYPVFTIPESISLSTLEEISNIFFFSNLDQEDFLAIDTLYRMFPATAMNVAILYVPGKKDRGNISKTAEALLAYCSEHYPGFKFSLEALRPGNAIADFKAIAEHNDVNLIALPNKKRSVFSRFFNPSLAHRLLLHADIPMLVIPV